MKICRRRRTRRARVSEATIARVAAEQELERVKAETSEYAALSEQLRREIRGRNHLTELFLNLHHGRG